MYKIKYHKKAVKEISNLKTSNLDAKAKKLIELIRENPYQTPPPYEKLTGDLKGLYSRRINIQHRLIYQVNENDKILTLSTCYNKTEKVVLHAKLMKSAKK